jgi:apolipoprotein N-acyltransferase
MLALCAGALLPLAFAPLAWGWLAAPLLATLFVTLRDASAQRAAWIGACFGFGSFGAGVSWLHISIHQFGHAPLPLTWALTLAFIAIMALFPALAAALASSARRQRRVHLLLALPGTWVVSEWLRGWFLTGFPWLQLGYSQLDTPLAALAPIGGVHAVGLALAFSAGLIAALWELRGRGRIVAACALLALWGGAVALDRVQWTQPAAKALRVALVQGNISQAVKWRPDEREPTLELYRALTEKNWDRDLIVWPETAVPLFYHQVAEDYLTALERDARAQGAELLIGIPFIDPASDRYYNAIMSLGGVERRFYSKRHLVPFGEYVPFSALAGDLLEFMDIPMSDFSSGREDQPLLEAAGQRIGATICYEDAFGNEQRHALPSAGLLVNVSNDAWFGDSLAPHQHLQMARLRARETGRPMLRATNTGISAVIGARGEIIVQSPRDAVHVLRAEITPRRGATPYARLGDAPAVLLAAALLLTALSRRRERGL